MDTVSKEIYDELNEEVLRLKEENKRLRLNDVECHYKRDILDSLYEAWARLPACGALGIIGGAIQEIQALRQK